MADTTDKPPEQGSDEDAFNELTFYTLTHPDAAYFIHQHAVDAFKAQNVNQQSSPISVLFPLAGLYLFLEKGYTGKAVQVAHMKMAGDKKAFPSIVLPVGRGNITVKEVLNAAPGPARDAMIRSWCESVWKAYEGSRPVIVSVVNRALGL